MCEGLGATTLLKYLGVVGVKARMHLGATAAKGLIKRRGCNKVRPIETDVLAPRTIGPADIIPLAKVLRAEHIADLTTKNLTAIVIQEHLTKTQVIYAEGRSDAAQQLHSVGGLDHCEVRRKGRSEIHEVLGQLKNEF